MATDDLSGSTEDETPVRRRTRRAIIEAAVEVWARDFGAPLGVVAEQAGVSRSTLHRYFADRADLVKACLLASAEAFDSTAPEVEPDVPALDALVAQLEGVLTHAHWVLFLWADPRRFADHPEGRELVEDNADPHTLALLRRGQEDGSVVADVPAEFLLNVFYSVIYCGAEAVVNGGTSVVAAARMAAAVLRGGLSGARP